MSTTFTQFLEEQDKKYRQETGNAQAIIDEWNEAVESLFATIRTWLQQSDPKGVIAIEEGEHTVNEPGLGRYIVPRLDLRAFGQWIGLIPKARHTVGTVHPPQANAPQRAQGRVDITDEIRRYILYRSCEPDGSVWTIQDPTVVEPAQLFDREAFETALMSYLQ